MQWRNRWRSRGSRVPPDIFDLDILSRSKRGKEESKNGEKKQENLKGKRWKFENGRRKGMKMSR